MPLKKLFQNIHGSCSQPSAPSVFMVINPHRKPKHKLPYVELRGHRSLPGYGVRGCCLERLVAVDSERVARHSSKAPRRCGQLGGGPPPYESQTILPLLVCGSVADSSSETVSRTTLAIRGAESDRTCVDLRGCDARQRELRNIVLIKEVHRICLVTTSWSPARKTANEEEFIRIPRNRWMTMLAAVINGS
jgi:hypothetical protein